MNTLVSSVKSVELNAEQQNALETMLSGKNCFLTGEAGTGKSTVIGEFLRRTNKNTVIVAPTGIAAVNIGGVTIHSYFQFPCTILNAGELEGIRSPKRRELIANTEVVIIDEISMTRSDLFSAVDTRLRYLGDSSKPFGGKQIIVCGDFFQLPPFAVTDAEKKYLDVVFNGIYAFQTPAWQKADFEVLFLKTVHRQSSDPVFAKMLAHIRQNDMSADIHLPEVDEMVSALDALNIAAVRKPEDNTVALCTTRNEAFAINIKKAAEIEAPVHRFTAKVSGEFKPALYPTVECLELKVGERVMTLANKYDPELVYCNGDIGTITAIDGDTVTVAFDKGTVSVVTPFVWSNFEYELVNEGGKTRIMQKEVGRFTQVPLRLAYATTIHKSQGLSLDSAHIVLGSGCFAAGQLYTALSRVRSLKGLTIDREIKADDLFFDKAVIDFYNMILADEEKAVSVMMEIPAAYADEIRRLIIQLQNQEKIA